MRTLCFSALLSILGCGIASIASAADDALPPLGRNAAVTNALLIEVTETEQIIACNASETIHRIAWTMMGTETDEDTGQPPVLPAGCTMMEGPFTAEILGFQRKAAFYDAVGHTVLCYNLLLFTDGSSTTRRYAYDAYLQPRKLNATGVEMAERGMTDYLCQLPF